MKFEIRKYVSVSAAKSLLGAGNGEDGPLAHKRNPRVALVRGLAIFFLAIPVMALAPWMGGAGDNGAVSAHGGDSQRTAPADIGPAGPGGKGTASATAVAFVAPTQNPNGGMLHADSPAYGAFPWPDHAGMALLTADAEDIPGLGMSGNQRFGAARSGRRTGVGTAFPEHFLGGPGSASFSSSMPFGGGSRLGGNSSPVASNSPGNTPSSAPSDSVPEGGSGGSTSLPAQGGTAPQGGSNDGQGPVGSNPPIPVVDDEGVLALDDTPPLQDLLPPPPQFTGSPLPGSQEPAATDPTQVAATAISIPGTPWLMLVAFPLLFFFGGSAASRR